MYACSFIWYKTIRYRYPMKGREADLKWRPVQSISIPSGENVVFWIINRGNQELKVSDFNRHYGTSLYEEVDEKEHKTHEDKIDKTSNQTQAQLPLTATSYSNWLFTGLLLMLFGIDFIFMKRGKE
ncbi:hypothetical protein LC087_11195 [Bacillus carboniphilus]|uniref:Gram-positive cocci surface proteins LPxTG domain-containing protein n=1 Tax=Bacillus carboniphilus TaxID=86663 RepID=A0ABY9JT52_9BACI|nr:hypothetical protein [Bacillus carboniphilus]WLR41463.1 hypothetical protein LC087_11195 [Bacillus carboniphilus]